MYANPPEAVAWLEERLSLVGPEGEARRFRPVFQPIFVLKSAYECGECESGADHHDMPDWGPHQIYSRGTCEECVRVWVETEQMWCDPCCDWLVDTYHPEWGKIG
jgi:hypothetical protein